MLVKSLTRREGAGTFRHPADKLSGGSAVGEIARIIFGFHVLLVGPASELGASEAFAPRTIL